MTTNLQRVFFWSPVGKTSLSILMRSHALRRRTRTSPKAVIGVRTPPRFPKGGKLSFSSTRAKTASETKTEVNSQLTFPKVCQPNDHSLAVIKYGPSPFPLKVVRTETVRPWESGVDVVILVISRDLASNCLYQGTTNQLNGTVHPSNHLLVSWALSWLRQKLGYYSTNLSA